MEPLNKVQLRGTVGFLRLREISDTTIANFSLCVEECYTSRDGRRATFTQNINCAAWSDVKRPVHELQKGCEVEVLGRIVNRRYTDRDGVERTITEVKADSLRILSYPAGNDL